MKTRHTLAAFALFCAGALAPSALKPAAALADSQCKPVIAVERDALVAEGCPSPIGFCAGGTVSGNHGLRGTSFYSAANFDPIPSDPQGRLVVPGILTYTTDDGVLTIDDVSVFDVARGIFAGAGRITNGTGRFAGATGDIFTTGRMDPGGTSFVTEVTGRLCLP